MITNCDHDHLPMHGCVVMHVPMRLQLGTSVDILSSYLCLKPSTFNGNDDAKRMVAQGTLLVRRPYPLIPGLPKLQAATFFRNAPTRLSIVVHCENTTVLRPGSVCRISSSRCSFALGGASTGAA